MWYNIHLFFKSENSKKYPVKQNSSVKCVHVCVWGGGGGGGGIDQPLGWVTIVLGGVTVRLEEYNIARGDSRN